MELKGIGIDGFRNSEDDYLIKSLTYEPKPVYQEVLKPLKLNKIINEEKDS
ncbi:hypothetical protein D3C86_2124370 [compost metagenome]